MTVDTNSIRERYYELLNIAHAPTKYEICATLNSEFEDVIIYVSGDDLYVDCSDFSQIDVKIS